MNWVFMVWLLIFYLVLTSIRTALWRIVELLENSWDISSNTDSNLEQ